MVLEACMALLSLLSLCCLGRKRAFYCFYDDICAFSQWPCQTRIYDRTLKPIPPRPSAGLRYRIETVIGLTGLKMAKYRPSWSKVALACVNIVWRPHLLAILLYEVDKHNFVA